jgi:hypothetical protein
MARLSSHRDVILALGGPSQLARSLGIYKAAPPTGHWSLRGIPSRYWHRVADLAADASIPVTARDLETMADRQRRRCLRCAA